MAGGKCWGARVMSEMKNRGQATVSRFLLGIVAFLPLMAWAGAVEDLKQFLNETKTFRAEFSQAVVGKSGRKPQQSSGVVSISRPGKLRWEIIKPYPQLVVGDGEKFWIYDQELAQVTIKKAGQTLGSTPAALLSGNNDLERNFSLKELPDAEGLSWLEATPKNADSGFDKVRVGLAGKVIKVMELHDSFGQITHLRFSAMERNLRLPAENFRFIPPAGVDVLGE